MGYLQRLADGGEDLQCFLGRHPGLDPLLQIAALQVLHGDVDVTLVDTDVVNGDDVAVAQGREDSALVQEALGPLPGLGLLQHLERHLTLQGFLHGAEHHRHAAGAHVGIDLVAWDIELGHGSDGTGTGTIRVLPG